MATLERIEQALPTMTEAERAAYAEHIAEFARAALNGAMTVLRSSIYLAEQAQEVQAVTQTVERALRPWTP